MKSTFLTFILSLLAFISINANSPSMLSLEEKKPIELKGDTENNRGKSLIIPFEAWQINNDEIEVVSYHACTDVTVNICTVSGQILDSQTFSLISMQSVIFYIGNYAEGYYQVNITTQNGTAYTGTFMIE